MWKKRSWWMGNARGLDDVANLPRVVAHNLDLSALTRVLARRIMGVRDDCLLEEGGESGGVLGAGMRWLVVRRQALVA